MLDFSRITFNKSLRLKVKTATEIKSKYKICPLSSVVEIISGGTPDTSVPEYWNGDIPWLSVNDFNTGFRYVSDAEKYITQEGLQNSNTNYLQPDDVIMSARGTVGVVAQIKRPMTFNQSCYGLRSKGDVSNSYLYYVLLNIREEIVNLATGSKFPSIVRTTFDSIKIPIPPISIQEQIVVECEKIDEEYNSTRMSIENYRKKIEDLFNKLDVISIGGGRLSLANPEDFDISIGKRVLNKQLVPTGTIPVYSANVTEPFGNIDELLITDFSVPSVLWGIDGDWMTSFMPANEEFYPTDHCGVLRCKTEAVNPRYLAHVLEKEGRRMGFSRSYRASLDRIEGITFTVTDRKTQDDAVNEINTIEARIKDAEDILNSLKGKISDVLNSYLT